MIGLKIEMSKYELLYWYDGKTDHPTESVYMTITVTAPYVDAARTLAAVQLAAFADDRYFQLISTRELA